MNDKTIEQEIQAKGLTAPRVTPDAIEAEIDSEWYIIAADGVPHDGFHAPVGAVSPLRQLTFCVLVLRNGFTVTGESACASLENFDAEIGRKIARQNAVQKIWPLLGFRLRDQLAAKADAESSHLPPHVQRMVAELAELDDRHGKLAAFLKTAAFLGLNEDDRNDLSKQFLHMADYGNVLRKRVDRATEGAGA